MSSVKHKLCVSENSCSTLSEVIMEVKGDKCRKNV